MTTKLRVTTVQVEALDDHLDRCHGLSSHHLHEETDARLEEIHRQRHSQAWTDFHGTPSHTH